MSLRLTASLAALAAASMTLTAAPDAARAEEGMWTFDNFPIARANAALGTNINQAWLDRVRLSSVRFGGCSAGVVSAQGLVLTNNHCVASCVANLSTPSVNYAETGFTPRSREQELKCPGGTAEILTDISDVTARVHAVGAGLTGQAFTRARSAGQMKSGKKPAALRKAGCQPSKALLSVKACGFRSSRRFRKVWCLAKQVSRGFSSRLAKPPQRLGVHRSSEFGGRLRASRS